jgi:hypothetical protein
MKANLAETIGPCDPELPRNNFICDARLYPCIVTEKCLKLIYEETNIFKCCFQ